MDAWRHLLRDSSGAPANLAAMAELRDIAKRALAEHDGKPTEVVVFRTKRPRGKEAIARGIVRSDRLIYLIVLRGHFTTRLDTPTGDRIVVRGRAITRTVDAQTLGVPDGRLA